MVLKCLYEPITASQRHYMTKFKKYAFHWKNYKEKLNVWNSDKVF